MPEHIQFDSPEVAETFRANTERRTISGLAVPWGKVARSGFSRWRFEKNSLRWGDTRRIKLNLNHDPERAIGFAAGLRNTNEGLDVTFKVVETEEGDKALKLADGGVWDGLSIEVDFEDGDDEWVEDSSGVRVVRSGRLRGVALTPIPAFDDARTTEVVASATPMIRINKEMKMPDGQTQNNAAENNDAPASEIQQRQFMEMALETFGSQFRDEFKELAKELTASNIAAMEALLERRDDPQDGRQSVSASRYAVNREEPVYTFDGRGPSLVADAVHAAIDKEPDAIDRLRRFQSQNHSWGKAPREVQVSHAQFAAVSTRHEFAVTTSNASEIIPPGYRPDLYQDELTKGRPLVNGVSRGTLTNAAPFTVPVFVSSSAATADHVEGTNPSGGTMTFGAKTITPVAISGKFELTREMVDAGNPAIDQIAIATMRESYASQTETKMYNLLNGEFGQGGSITSGSVPSGAQVAVTSGDGPALLTGIRKALALYPFNRFAAPDAAYLSKEATTAIATAVGADDRPLLPSVGAMNTAGIGNAVTQGWFVDGLPHVPAWVMTDNEAGDADVLTFRSSDIYAFESPQLLFRFEEKQGPALIELALFGYFAAHVLRPVGISAIRHTSGS